jgi:cell cycle sensor histidine kinase DivJ
MRRALGLARADAERSGLAKSRFLAIMSHELRTPLNAVIGFSQMLLDEKGLMIDAKQRHDYARLINESGRHLLSVVNGMLDISKLESGHFDIEPERFAPARVIADCCDLLTPRAQESGITLRAELPGDLPELVADKRAFHQIMLNLLANAVKFSDRGGTVKVDAAVDAAVLVIAIEDTGVGIASEDLPRIGEPFFQARSSYDRRHDGTGLGISIVKGLLGLHGGRMDIESHLGEGTRVVVRLPLDCQSSRLRSRPCEAQQKIRVGERA